MVFCYHRVIYNRSHIYHMLYSQIIILYYVSYLLIYSLYFVYVIATVFPYN